ncbi:hypothetical protein [Paenibacillus shenyangensis]|uniref:hypothetical protein n=1 Tax=Paenibacillus sp. A9 TaxID=1284352 RepID=UPI000477CDB3|nr:hypothetical protein [Paenibacillus sp. A9]
MDNEIMPSNNRTGYSPANTNLSNFEIYLRDLGLPADNVIAESNEREQIMQSFPYLVGSLKPEVKAEARYLSKFIAASAIGLFDAALNYIWNEVITSLRQKIIVYGLDLFFDAAVGQRNRDQFSEEADLAGIKDKVLLDNCRKLELIGDLLHKKLSHVLTMRNDIGSSHPNTYSINSFELLGWLKTCVDEVIEVSPSKAAMTVRSIVDNIKKSSNELRPDLIATFESSIADLSTKMTGNLLTTVFSLFTGEATQKVVQENILKIAPALWMHSTDSVKYELGEKIDVYKTKLDTERVTLAERFFDECGGNRYFTASTKFINITTLCDDLYSAHVGWDNFYYEPNYARELMKIIGKSDDIPKEREEKLIKTILSCRLGNGVSYCEGVSPGAKKYYDQFFSILDSNQIKLLLSYLVDDSIRVSLSGERRSRHMKSILQIIRTPLNSERVNEAIDYLLAFSNDLYNAPLTKGYKEIISNF